MIGVWNEASKRTNKLQLLKLERKERVCTLVDPQCRSVFSRWKIGPTDDLSVDTQEESKVDV
jgi:hypothetical protein